MKSIQEELFKLQDPKNAEFMAKLTPGIPKEKFLGIRVPQLRKYAKELEKTEDCQAFLIELPHEYYDENLLHSILLSNDKSYERCMENVESFLPYIDNWAVSDTLTPKIIKKHLSETLPKIKDWIQSPETYTCRVGVDWLMSFYLDEAFEPEYLELPAAVQSEEYYVNMMIAWYYATALAKQWDSTIPYIEEHRLPDWVHKKTIQKARESYRITESQKDYLKSLR